jgi:FSR family fosmidomycin resistance protein-like MFS transporter
LAAAVIGRYGQRSVAWFAVAALCGVLILFRVGRWYAAQHVVKKSSRPQRPPFPRKVVIAAIVVLLVLIFSKYFYIAGLSSFYTFYLIEKFGLPVRSAQLHLFIFLFASAIGTVIGGPIGDRIGRKPVIWASILGVAPFALILPHADLFWTTALTVVIGLVLSSAFSAILVYAQELMPGRVGLVAGMFFGFSFGLGGLGAAALGQLADWTSIETVYKVTPFLLLLGILTVFLPRYPGRPT